MSFKYFSPQLDPPHVVAVQLLSPHPQALLKLVAFLHLVTNYSVAFSLTGNDLRCVTPTSPTHTFLCRGYCDVAAFEVKGILEVRNQEIPQSHTAQQVSHET